MSSAVAKSAESSSIRAPSSMPNTVRRITSRVIASVSGSSANVLPRGQPLMRRPARSSITWP